VRLKNSKSIHSRDCILAIISNFFEVKSRPKNNIYFILRVVKFNINKCNIRFEENMKVLKAKENNIRIAANIVKNGGSVVYPTETVYGLGCDPLNIEAVKKILNIKGNRNKPLPVLAATMKDAKRIAYISSKGKKLAAKFWPGPLTMVFPKKSILPDMITFGSESVGLRISNNEVAFELIRLSGGLLIGSSANMTGDIPPRNIKEISNQIKENVDIILDGGCTAQGKPSTVADLTTEKPKILRKGPITIKEILNTLAFNSH
jgi:L-threonylcarbamoyladenylate synthase